MKALGQFEVWLVTGSQQLYGDKVLGRVDEHSREVAESLNDADVVPVRVVHKPVVTSADSIRRLCMEANATADCVGVMSWMHTFSPAKMWIAGLAVLQKPLLHLHTQFNRDLPWGEIDMDFMNLNQSAHGDREFGFIGTRMGLKRKTVVGHWRDPSVVDTDRNLVTCRVRLAGGADAQRRPLRRQHASRRSHRGRQGGGSASPRHSRRRLRHRRSRGRCGDVSERRSTCWSTSTSTCTCSCRLSGGWSSPRITAGRSADRGGSARFSRVGRLQGVHGYLRGSGRPTATSRHRRAAPDGGRVRVRGEGDWKTAALVRITKVMSAGLAGGTSFMEDYTYHLAPEGPQVLGAHMLEVCPSIASPVRSPPARSTRSRSAESKTPFGSCSQPRPGRPWWSASSTWAIVSVSSRMRWTWCPRLRICLGSPLRGQSGSRSLTSATAAEAWLLAGGAHHTSFSQSLDLDVFTDLAEIGGLELLAIDAETRMRDVKNELRWNQAYFHLARGL